MVRYVVLIIQWHSQKVSLENYLVELHRCWAKESGRDLYILIPREE